MNKDSKIPIKINITGEHRSFDGKSYGEPEETVEEAYGFLSKRGSSTYLVYETTVDKGLICSNMIKICREPIEIKKTATFHKGTVTSPGSCLIYAPGKTGTGFYNTPYGRLDTETVTETADIRETAHSLTCLINGKMKINNSPVSEFKLKIEAVCI